MMAVEGCLLRINEVGDPLELAEVLVSDWPFADKVKVLLAMPNEAIKQNTSMRILETRLEDSGYSLLAQVVRWRSFYSSPRCDIDRAVRWANTFVMGEIGMHRNIQRKTYLLEETMALKKSLAVSSDKRSEESTQTAQLDKYEKELEFLNNEHWGLLRAVAQLEGDMAAGVFSKAFNSCRANPDWYLCQWLRQDCAKRGGCCGRSCGCCEKTRSTNRQGTRGHCTTMCGCCIRTQGRTNISYESGKSEDFHFYNNASRRTRYNARINRAYIWGLSFLDELGFDGYLQNVDI